MSLLRKNLAAPNRWKSVTLPVVLLVIFVLMLQKIQLIDCAKVTGEGQPSANADDSNNNSANSFRNATNQNTYESQARLNTNRTHITDLVRKAVTKGSDGFISSKSVFRLLRKISQGYIVPGLNNLLNAGSGNSLSKRSHDSTFALIAFVTFSTFVLFTLLPLLTLPRRQRIGREYTNRIRAKNGLKPLSSLQHFYKPATLARYKKKALDVSEVKYAAIAVPIDSIGNGGGGGGARGSHAGGGDGGRSSRLKVSKSKSKGHHNNYGDSMKTQMQADFESDVNDLWHTRMPGTGATGTGAGAGGYMMDNNDPAVGIKTYNLGGGYGLDGGDAAGGEGGGGWSSQESQPIHLSTITDSDNEYLTKEEIQYLLKTL